VVDKDPLPILLIDLGTIEEIDHRKENDAHPRNWILCTKKKD
jgi:hypothetical protein